MIHIVPYVQINGSWTLPDDAIKGLYRIMDRDRSVRRVWYTGAVKNEDDFLATAKNPNTHMILMTTEEPRPIGIVWLNNVAGKSAQIHFVMFREFWGNLTIEAGKLAVDYFMGIKDREGEPIFDVLMGVTPGKYGMVINYIKEVGVTVIGTIPHLLFNYWTGKAMDGTFSYICRKGA